MTAGPTPPDGPPSTGTPRPAGPGATDQEAPTRIPVRGDQPYEVLVGYGLGGALLPLLGRARVVAVVHPRALSATGEAARDELLAAGIDAHAVEVPDGEEAKDLQVAAFLWDVLGQVGLGREDVVVAVGGGSTTDLAGFVAATWLRGVRVVHLPTTLLGMVDAAVGGKTGINTATGKNLVGAFHEPTGVLCDLSTLETLPKHDYTSGLAEVVKCGFIADPRILELIEEDVAAAATPAGPHTRELVERTIAVKARVVSGDLREAGVRETLNYGHTLGHAVEQAEDYKWRHGAAVSVGMVFAAELARVAGSLPDAAVERHRTLLARLGLPISYAGDWQRLRHTMGSDKKTRGGRLRFVVLDDVARPRMLEDPDPSLLVAAFEEVRRDRGTEVFLS